MGYFVVDPNGSRFGPAGSGPLRKRAHETLAWSQWAILIGPVFHTVSAAVKVYRHFA